MAHKGYIGGKDWTSPDQVIDVVAFIAAIAIGVFWKQILGIGPNGWLQSWKVRNQ